MLLPDEGTTRNFLYCLGLAAQKYQIELIFTLASTNHHHTGIYDAHGRWPEFVEHFHKMLARCQNAHWGRREAMWASEQVNVVELATPEDVLQKLIYALSNPVKDSLVEKAHHWPGASSLGATRGNRPLVVSRPLDFFREGGRSPDAVELRFRLPPGLEAWTHEQWVAEIDQRIEAVEVETAETRRREGRQVLGRKAVMSQSWKACPSSVETRRGPKPRHSTASKWARAAALQRRKAFLAAYRRARDALMDGRLPIEFPEGTYWRLKPLPFRPEAFAAA